MGATAAVLGASGFSGAELVRLLAGHPALEVRVASSERSAGEPLAAVVPSMAASELRLVTLQEAVSSAVDVCFSCLPSGMLGPHLPELRCEVMVDLADDHRGTAGWVYGLTEWARPAVGKADRIANPGCYPTAILLCLLPFARAGLLPEIVAVDAISGVSGAGRKNEDRLLHGVVDGNVSAYGTGTHRHTPEIERELETLGGAGCRISFTPHLAPMARGLLVTARAIPTRTLTSEDAMSLLQEAYASEPFVQATNGWPQTKALSGSNGAHVSARVDAAGFLICSAAIDNLGKGAAGQAIQNANLALGLEETAGLSPIGVWP